MATQWDEFAKAEPDQPAVDPWDEFKPAKGKRGGASKTASPLPAPATPTLTGQAVDGDTLKTTGPENLRIYGTDAPELKQQGWDQQGQPVPIGQNALLSMEGLASTPPLIAGPVVGESYNRPVAPVTANGIDVGQSQIRSGNALAAP